MQGQSLQRAARACAAIVLLALPGWAMAALVDAVEYYHAGFDHYFVTANADEIAKLDAGFFTGWQRTGERFTVGDSGTPIAGASPVCRFYGNPQFGLDSHFYSASPAECAAVQQNFGNAWLLEASNVFQVYLPDTTTGACPAGTAPIYRAWNGRADSNHRYTTSLAIQQSMIAQGYVAEGYGSSGMPVAMCSPMTTTGAAPQCTLAASDASPAIGTTIRLTASCTGSPTSYVWSGCASTTATCMVRSDAPGTVTYGVRASNATGAGNFATVNVGWHDAAAPSPVPACVLSVTSQGATPVVGSTAVLNATCTNLPTSYSWAGCMSGSNGSTCYVTENAAGPHTYTLTASNRGGAGAPVSISLDWAATPGAQPDFCGSFPDVLWSRMPWSNVVLYSIAYPEPSFAWNGAWVAKFTVPFGATATRPGTVDVVEYGGGPTGRQVTISRAACDFRPTDPTGANGPIYNASALGVSAGITLGTAGRGTVALQPGETYYVNVRNAWPDGTLSCPQSTGSCGALLGLTVPR